MELKLISSDSRDGVDTIYVGETVTLCLIIADGHRDPESITVVLNNFSVAESRRLYSDSTTEIHRMRSVDSLLTEDQHYSNSTAHPYAWNKYLADNKLYCTLPFTPQPMSDDSCSIKCLFSVSVRAHREEMDDSNLAMDPFVEHYLSSSFGPVSKKRSVVVDLGDLELSVVLCNPLRITKQLTPQSSHQCLLRLELEAIEEDLRVADVKICILPVHSVVQSGQSCSMADYCATLKSQLPVCIGSLGDHVDFAIEAGAISAAQPLKTKIDIVVEPVPGRTCRLTFESPFDPLASFLPPNSDDFVVLFSCDTEEVKVGGRFRVRARIMNRTSQAFDISFLFPLQRPGGSPAAASCATPPPGELSRLLQAHLDCAPAFVCTEAERLLGAVRPHSVYDCQFEFMAAVVGTHPIHLVQMRERREGHPDRLIDFPNILTLTVKF